MRNYGETNHLNRNEILTIATLHGYGRFPILQQRFSHNIVHHTRRLCSLLRLAK